MIRRGVLLISFVLAVIALAAASDRDPLNKLEVDQLRDAAQSPNERIHLYLQFARARLASIDQLRADPKLAQGRGQQIHNLLEDFTAILQEMDDNLDVYGNRQKADLRKALKEVVEADTDFQLRLRTLKDAAKAGPQAATEAKEYDFTLDDALDAVASSAENARGMIEEQEAAAAAAADAKKQKKH